MIPPIAGIRASGIRAGALYSATEMVFFESFSMSFSICQRAGKQGERLDWTCTRRASAAEVARVCGATHLRELSLVLLFPLDLADRVERLQGEDGRLLVELVDLHRWRYARMLEESTRRGRRRTTAHALGQAGSAVAVVA